MKMHARIVAACAAFAIGGPAVNAAIVPINETFTNANTGAAIGAPWSIIEGSATFTLRSGDSDDVSDLGDAAGDGYGLIDSQSGSSQNISLRRDLGTIDAGDVGKIVTASLAYLEVSQGATYDYWLRVDGVNVAHDTASTFASVPSLYVGEHGVLTASYTIQPGDVGKNFDMRLRYYDSTTTGSRDNGVDQFIVTVVPTPAALPAGLVLATIFAAAHRRR
jgi:hypothetical protein